MGSATFKVIAGLRLWLLAAVLLGLAAPIAAAQQPQATDAKMSELIRLLDDPAVRARLAASQPGKVAPSPDLVQAGVEEWEQGARSRFQGILRALPTLPAQYAAIAGRVQREAMIDGYMPLALIVFTFLLLALAAEWIVRILLRRALAANPLLSRTVTELIPLVAFVLVGSAAFFAVDWPPMLRHVILYYLIAAIGVRIVVAFSLLALLAGSLTRFMFRRVLLFAVIVLFSIASRALAGPLAIPPDVDAASSFVVSLLLFAIACEASWRRPEADGLPARLKLLHCAYFLLLWLVWTFGFHIVFWVGVYAALFPKLMPYVDRMARAYAATRWPDESVLRLRSVFIVRGARAAVYVAAVIWLGVVWKYNPSGLMQAHSLLDPIVFGLLHGLIVLLIADLGWNLAKALIDEKLDSVRGDTLLPTEEAAHRARLGTLLPILRNALAALIAVLTALTVLAGMGVQIAPLIAGAGIFGVAIGFGAQTLVKDIISGIFYLLDDAFRVGEYIQSGDYKGTVESFSLRSVRLRHHRGPIFTVPFGELGAVQNMSRDWAIDKFVLRVNFDTDINKAKKLVKTIGAQLREDEEIGPLIIENLKMKGVEQISDYGIELAFYFTSVPGYQSMIRRRAYVLIRQVFKENGIQFAQPTVHVGGDDKGDSATAASSLLTKMQSASNTPSTDI